MPDIAPILAHLDADLEPALERLFALLRHQSVSTDPAYAEGCRAAAVWLKEDLASIGIEARLADAGGQPIVIGHGGEGAPHLLFYGHYDVQPVDPLELWDHPPFEPMILEGADGTEMIHGRGASDDKGQVMTFLEALRAFHAVRGRLPCRITVLLEGEEESGGEALTRFLETDADELRADLALVCDTGMWDAETPAISTMLRGNATEEVTIRAADRDLHSGFYGGAAANPIHVLAAALAAMRDGAGRVTLAGFYDHVPELDPEIRAQWDALGFSEEAFLGAIDLAVPAGEAGRSALEQVWSRPTAEVNGIWGGYTGAGFKTVIPSEAHAKVSFRLVGAQDPEQIRDAFRAHIRAHLPPDCSASFESHGAGPAITMPTDAPAFATARAALSEEWGTEAAFIGCGGSIPIVGQLKRALDLDTLLIGFALEDDRIHSPNEKYNLTSFTKGCRSWVRVLATLSEGGGKV